MMPFPVNDVLLGLPLSEDFSTPGHIRIFICFNFVAPFSTVMSAFPVESKEILGCKLRSINLIL